jgi:protein-L-isoaspartate O-methyltransferase
VQDGTGTGIHSAVVRATGRVVVLESCAHLVSKCENVYTSNPVTRISV